MKLEPYPSNWRIILEVARQLPQPFTLSGLIVAVWRAHPATFGLKGYDHIYPDSNRVATYLYGRKGMVGHGLLEKVGQGVFRVSVTQQKEAV